MTTTGGHTADEAVVRAHREEWARMVAALVRRFGDLDVAEEAVADAFAAALARWRLDGPPVNPGGWLMTTATRRALDRVRRDAVRARKHEEAFGMAVPERPEPLGPVGDDRLRLVFMCCHPALAPEARVALTLRLVAGLTVADIAEAFLVRETTMAQRITRAKGKIKAARVPFRTPEQADLDARVDNVLTVVFLVFNEGYLPHDGQVLRTDLTEQALRLARLTHELLPHHGEAKGLLALLLLTDARRDARVSPDGVLVPLPEQDRSRWDHEKVRAGHALVRECLATHRAGGAPPGRFQLLAAIAAVHTHAARADQTDWAQVVALYDRLRALDPSPVVALNRAVAVAELDGPHVALAELAEVADALAGYHPYHVARAELLRRAGREAAAADAYERAMILCRNPAEHRHLAARRDALSTPAEADPPERPGSGTPHAH